MIKYIRKLYLEENNEFYSKLIIGMDFLEKISFKLNTKFKINIKSLPWYKNIIEIYVPKSFEFYELCKNDDFDFYKYSDIWMRESFVGYISQIEKFIKFFVKKSLNINENLSFYKSINKLDDILEKYKEKISIDWPLSVSEIKDNLHRWRKLQNKNKHDEENIDSNYFFEGENNNTLIEISSDILEYVSDGIFQIICPLLFLLTEILEN